MSFTVNLLLHIVYARVCSVGLLVKKKIVKLMACTVQHGQWFHMQKMNEQAQSPIQSAVRPGIILGLVSMVLTYVAYFIDSSYLASGYFGLVALVLFIGLIIYFGVGHMLLQQFLSVPFNIFH